MGESGPPTAAGEKAAVVEGDWRMVVRMVEMVRYFMVDVIFCDVVVVLVFSFVPSSHRHRWALYHHCMVCLLLGS